MGSRSSDAVVIRSVTALRERLDSVRAAGRHVGLVPTMGALHDGHLALIGAAAEMSDEVVVSVFVNPTQFTQASDLTAYPRDLDRDVALAASAGATIVFAPAADEVYPPGFATSIHIGDVTERWEGATRGSSHFDGVALVVTKLFGMVGAHTAWFGQKDAQQVAVVRRLVADLNIPTRIHTVDTVRGDDGMALSSRNARLSADELSRATALHGSLATARALARSGERDTGVLAAAARAVLSAQGIEPEYWQIVDAATFAPQTEVGAGSLAIVAAFVGEVRLIDNMPMTGVAD